MSVFFDYLDGLIKKLYKEKDEKDKEIERLNNECDTYMKIATQKQIKIDKAIKKLKFIDEYFSNNEILQMQQLIQNHKEVLEILDKVGDKE